MAAPALHGMAPDQIVDLARYPITRLDAPVARQIVERARRQIAETGAAELPGFVPPGALRALEEEADALAPKAYRSAGRGTAYLGLPDLTLPEDHPRRWLGGFGVRVVAYDQFPSDSPLRRLYEWDPLMAFIGAVLGRGRLFRYADPLGALNLALMGDGDELQWHFDQTDFVVSLAIRPADEGGDFEVAPRIRTADDERYERVGRVLAGDSDEVVTLPLTSGTLLIFEGRHSIHRVSPIAGATDRVIALLAYDTRPGTTSSELLRRARYGRAG